MLFSPREWRAIPKDKWHLLILQWNRKTGTMKKIPRAISFPASAFLRPDERKGYDKWKKRQKTRDVIHSPNLVWEEVPQRLPYRITPDRKMMDCDDTFLRMAKIVPPQP